MMRRLLGQTLACLAVLSAVATAQAAVRVTGVAFDSVSGRPLSNALVALGPKRATADSTGRFSLDSVAPGTYRATMQHDMLDALGLVEISTSVTIGEGPAELQISTPSPATIWRRVCRSESPGDSGLVFGIVRDESYKPIANATVTISWRELRPMGRSVSQKGWKLEIRSGPDGSYVACGAPLGTGVTLAAAQDTVAFADVSLMLTDRASVRRQDLTVVDPRDSLAVGTIRGAVTIDYKPVANAVVAVDGIADVRTSANGSFFLTGVRAGTRQVNVNAIGFVPESRIVEVVAGQVTDLSITLGKVTILDSVLVTAATARTRLLDRFEDRRRTGLGYYRDSVQLALMTTWSAVFNGMTSVTIHSAGSSFSRINIGPSRGILPPCRAQVWVDRTRMDETDLASLRPSDIAAIEVYRPGQIPAELKVIGIGQPRPMAADNLCAVVVWTKRGTR